jgi:hypothetical protein
LFLGFAGNAIVADNPELQVARRDPSAAGPGSLVSLS